MVALNLFVLGIISFPSLFRVWVHVCNSNTGMESIQSLSNFTSSSTDTHSNSQVAFPLLQ